MFTYIVKRLFAMIPTLFGISFITFLIVLLAPGDPVATRMGDAGTGKEATGGAGNDLERQTDAIKAKKQLLGMLEEHRVVLGWDAADAVTARGWKSDDKYTTVKPMRAAADSADFDAWPRAIARLGTGSVAHVGLRNGRVLAVDMADGVVTHEFDAHAEGVTAIAVSPAGDRLASADGNGVVRLHDLAKGATISTAEALGLPIRDIVFVPDGSRFATAGSDGRIRIHSAKDGTRETELIGHSQYVAALAVSPDGRHLYSGGYDRALREWRTGDWKLSRVLFEHSQGITDIALSPDGSRIATASEDKHVRVFRAAAGADGDDPTIADLTGHYRAAMAVVFHPDGRTLFSAGLDETVRTWDVDDARQTAQVDESIGRVFDVAISPDGRTLLTAGDSWRKTPVTTQYWNWVSKLARFDLGRSFIDKEPVIDKMAKALPVTIGLNVCAFLIIYLISIPLGVAGAVKRGSAFDSISSLIVFLLWSMPSFWLGTLLIMYLSSERNWNLFPSVGLHDLGARDLSYLAWLGDWAKHLVLPSIVLVYGGFASLSRYARSSMLETISQDYIRTARAKGLSERVVIYKHALRNSLIAIITLMGTLLPAMIGGSVIVEYLFNIRGMGLLAFNAILQRDYPVIMAVTTFSALLTLVGVLTSDILYSVADPRITHK